MMTEEFQAKAFPSDDVRGLDKGTISGTLERRTEAVSKMALGRLRPRAAKSRDLVPAHIRERSVDRWAAEDREWLAGIKWEASLRGRFRLWLKKVVGI